MLLETAIFMMPIAEPWLRFHIAGFHKPDGEWSILTYAHW